jgi:hypothetical protein
LAIVTKAERIVPICNPFADLYRNKPRKNFTDCHNWTESKLVCFPSSTTVGMIWWCVAYTLRDIALFWIRGEIVGFGWVLIMTRLGYFAET